MEFADIIFPLNLGPLTYRVPEAMRDSLKPGQAVSVQIRNRMTLGIVLRPALEVPAGALKELGPAPEDAPALSGAMLRMIEWMAGYYFAREGTVLKCIYPKEFFKFVKARKKKSQADIAVREERAAFIADEASAQAIEEIRDYAGKKYYMTFLLQSPTRRHELDFLVESLAGIRGAIVICPDIKKAAYLEDALRAAAGERLVLYHSGLSDGERSHALKRMQRGDADIVLGSRFAAFAPLPEVSMIAVVEEESKSYKDEGGIRFNARDMAVMRGYLEGAPVILASLCPSVESYHNSMIGKYKLVAPKLAGIARAKVRVIDLRGVRGAISDKLRKAAEDRIKRNEGVMLIVNKRGYSFLRCSECGHLESCPECGIALEYHKAGRVLRCPQCGKNKPVTNKCPKCRGASLEPVGAGIERAAEEIGELGRVIEDEGKPYYEDAMGEEHGAFILGSRIMTRGMAADVTLAGVINADAYRHIPDFRASERAFRDMLYAADMVGPDGELILQSRFPDSRIISRLKHYDLKGFYKDELSERETLGYPPFARMISILISSDAEPEIAGYKDVMCLGPMHIRGRGEKRYWKVLLKSRSKDALRHAVRDIVKRHSKEKEDKIIVDVDPL